jgi:lysophospholipase L1-like esterase
MISLGLLPSADPPRKNLPLLIVTAAALVVDAGAGISGVLGPTDSMSNRSESMTRLTMAFVWLLTAIWPVSVATAQEPAADKWEKEIAASRSGQRVAATLTRRHRLCRCSSIRKWDVAKSFPELLTINRGFGGSQLADSVKYVPRIVVPYRPKTVVLYAGDNDIAGGKSPQQIAADFAALVKAIHGKLPETKILFLAIKPSPSRWKSYEHQQTANRLIREQCEAGHKLVYVDLVTPMLGADGMPRGELFVKDQLHLSDAGYALWAKVLTPHLNKGNQPSLALSPSSASNTKSRRWPAPPSLADS